MFSQLNYLTGAFHSYVYRWGVNYIDINLPATWDFATLWLNSNIMMLFIKRKFVLKIDWNFIPNWVSLNIIYL